MRCEHILSGTTNSKLSNCTCLKNMGFKKKKEVVSTTLSSQPESQNTPITNDTPSPSSGGEPTKSGQTRKGSLSKLRKVKSTPGFLQTPSAVLHTTNSTSSSTQPNGMPIGQPKKESSGIRAGTSNQKKGRKVGWARESAHPNASLSSGQLAKSSKPTRKDGVLPSPSRAGAAPPSGGNTRPGILSRIGVEIKSAVQHVQRVLPNGVIATERHVAKTAQFVQRSYASLPKYQQRAVKNHLFRRMFTPPAGRSVFRVHHTPAQVEAQRKWVARMTEQGVSIPVHALVKGAYNYRLAVLRTRVRRNIKAKATEKVMLARAFEGMEMPVGMIADNETGPVLGELDSQLHEEAVRAMDRPLTGTGEKVLLRQLEEEQEFSNEVALQYLWNLLFPGAAECGGYPDGDNRANSAKYSTSTVLDLPFVNNEVTAIVAANPSALVTLPTSTGGIGSGPNIVEMGNTNRWAINGEQVAAQQDFNISGQTTTMKVSYGYNLADDVGFMDAQGNRLPLWNAWSEGTDGSEKEYRYIKCAPGDTVVVSGSSRDTTAGRFKAFAIFVLETANVISTSTVTSAAAYGASATTGYAVSGNLTAPANTIGLYEYGIINQAAGGDYTGVNDTIRCVITLASDAPTVYPLGDAAGNLLSFLYNNADDFRIVGMRITVTPYTEKLANGKMVYGQWQDMNSAQLSDLSFDSLSVAPGMQVRQENDLVPGCSFPIFPMGANAYRQMDEFTNAEDLPFGVLKIIGNSADSDHCLLVITTDYQYRVSDVTPIPVSPGLCDLEAISMVESWIAKHQGALPTWFYSNNDDHEVKALEAIQSFEGQHPVEEHGMFEGAFSGNSFSLSLMGV